MDGSLTQQQPRREHIANRMVNAGLVTNIILAVVKVAVGIIGQSRALLADGINSTSDVAYYIVVKVFTKMAGKPADKEHPYGHHQMESIAAVVIGAFVIATAIAIFWESINTVYKLWTAVDKDSDSAFRSFSLLTACGTIVLKIILFSLTHKAAKATNNGALFALAYDHRNDIVSSAGAAVGIALGWVGLQWADPLAGACVALIVLKTGIHILRESSDELMDTIPNDRLEQQVRKMTSEVEGVRKVESLHAHRFGPYYVVNITIGVDGTLTVAEGDRIATAVEEQLYRSIELLKNVYVHFHPVTDGKP